MYTTMVSLKKENGLDFLKVAEKYIYHVFNSLSPNL